MISESEPYQFGRTNWSGGPHLPDPVLANQRGATFTGADLSQAELRRVGLAGVDLTGPL
ncbi:MAG TPA: pentapeptide repeat-containing protein [Ktedonobacteraceae bacterium]|nr:pentapeptide repeat-containing protein [Ktedonobacteraceae bacterium]